jgi:uncharacterized protein (TIGR03083 family)
VRIEYRLLERAIRYALSAAGHTTPQLLTEPTPCPGWDLGTLLLHLGESFDTLAGSLRARTLDPGRGYSGAEGPTGAPSAPAGGELLNGAAPPDQWEPLSDGELVAGLAGRAAALLWACAEVQGGQEPVAAGDRWLTTGVVAITGAIEVAVHGWDIAMTCGTGVPVPSGLATELLPYAALLVPRQSRPGLFADPVPVPRRSCSGDRLVAFLGRQPQRPAPGITPAGTRRPGR